MTLKTGFAAVTGLFMCVGVALGQGITIPEDTFTYDGTCPNTPPNYCDCVADTVGFAAAWPTFPGFASGNVKNDWANAAGCQTNSGYRGWTVPFSYFRQKGLQMNYKDLAALAAAIDPAKNAVNGTDDNPLVVRMYFYCAQTTASEDNTAFQVQLIAEEELAPVTQMIESPINPGEMVEAPLVLIHDQNTCARQNLTTDVPRRAIAFGFYGGDLGLAPKAYTKWYKAKFGIDLPCQLNSSENTMIYYNVLYDGTRWMQLNENFPVTGPGIVASLRQTYLQMTIKSTTIDLLVDSRDDGVAGGVTRTGIPRGYQGGFQKLVLGSSTVGDYPIYVDNVALEGGELVYMVSSKSGACCKPDHSCEMLPQTECEAASGTFKGVGVQCGVGEGRCCADPVVDGDHDGDVDMADFGALQRCIVATVTPELPAECRCFDTNNDGAINETDVENFATCASGAGVPANPACDNPT